MIDIWAIGPTAAALALRAQGFSPHEAERLVQLKIRYQRGDFHELTDQARWTFARWLIQHSWFSDWFLTTHELEQGAQNEW